MENKERVRREPRKRYMVLYYNVAEALISEFTAEEAGSLLLAMLKYDLYGEEAQFETREAKVMFEIWKRSADRDLVEFRRRQFERDRAADLKRKEVKALADRPVGNGTGTEGERHGE